MIQVSEHLFRDASRLTVTTIYISEVIEEDYGLYVWPCGIVLAEYIWQQKDRFLGVQVLELGAGTGLPGIVAAKLGAHVILTDLENNSKQQEQFWMEDFVSRPHVSGVASSPAFAEPNVRLFLSPEESASLVTEVDQLHVT